MDNTELEFQIRTLISNHLQTPVHDLSKNIFDDYGADDLDEIEIIMSIEEDFGVELPDLDYKTANDFIRETKKALGMKP